MSYVLFENKNKSGYMDIQIIILELKQFVNQI